VTEFTSVSGSPYVVLVNGVPDGITHTSWHKAAEHAQKLEDAHPERDHEIARSERVRVESTEKPLEVNGRTELTVETDPPNAGLLEGSLFFTPVANTSAVFRVAVKR
jgi:hypothetical protein